MAAGQTTAVQAFETWQESREYYSGQGHRRNMLSSDYTSVGIAHVIIDGYDFWVQEFGTSSTINTTATTALDGASTATIEVLNDYVTSATLATDPDSYSLSCKESGTLPTLTAVMAMTDTKPNGATRTVTIVSPTWSSGNTSYATVDNNNSKVTAVTAGSCMITASALGSTANVNVTVSHSTELSNAKAATCTEDGYTGDEICTGCDSVVTEGKTIAATGHSYAAVVTEPTCTEDGYTTYTCSVCGDSYSENIAATGHDYKAVVTEPTCTEGGYTTYTCANCGDSYIADETAATGHTSSKAVVENEVAVTCTEDGSYDSVVYCSACGKELSRESITIAATGHTADEAVTENYVAASHTTDGSYDSVVYCSACGKELSRESITIAAGGHTAGEAVTENYKAPTCTETGSYNTVVYCTECSEEISRETIEISATGHTASEAVTENYIDPTCVSDGSYDSVIYCSVCGEEISRETIAIDATGIHAYELDESASTAATCTKDGENVYVCSVCSDSYSVSVPAIGHNYEAAVTAPTCTKSGYTTYTCSVCGDSYIADETAATGHTLSEAVVENKVAATCTKDGSYDSVVYCSACGEELSRTTITTKATGHTAGEAVTENHINPTCVDEGSYDSVVYCSDCGEELSRVTVTIAATGIHTYVLDENASIAATCTEDGKNVYVCSICGDSYTENVSAAGHTAGEAVKENVVDATSTKDGSYDSVVYCTVCGEELSRETIVVAAISSSDSSSSNGSSSDGSSSDGSSSDSSSSDSSLSDSGSSENSSSDSSSTSNSSAGTTSETSSVETSDNTNLTLWIVLAGIALLVVGVIPL
ncbi:MAG: CAP domain-containing protein, partial [Clostridiales bacterium]|nr:CAP domain-containing protein [Clostridiales bacterium]